MLVWLDESRWEGFLEAGLAHGFHVRVTDALRFAQRSRVLLMHHEPTGLDVDIVLGAVPFEEQVVGERVQLTVGDLSIPISSPENLIIMKAVAHRPRDIGDIEGLLDTRPEVDRQRVRYWVGEFAKALEAPEILEDLERLLRRREKR